MSEDPYLIHLERHVLTSEPSNECDLCWLEFEPPPLDPNSESF